MGNQFTIIEKVETKSKNLIYEAIDKSQQKWIIKAMGQDSGAEDIDSREELTFLIGRLVGMNIPRTLKIERSLVKNLDDFDDITSMHKLVAVRYIDGSVASRVDGSIFPTAFTTDVVSNIFAFYLWIGDEDRGLDDVVIDSSNKAWLIDHGLTGPNGSTILRSAHPHESDYEEEPSAKILMCFPRKKSLLQKCLDSKISPVVNPEMIDRIKSLDELSLTRVVNSFRLVNRKGQPFTSQYISILLDRQKTLTTDYSDWLSRVKALDMLKL